MTDIEQGLKEAIESAKAVHGEHGDSYRPGLIEPDPFTAVRARTRGALVAAHRDLTPHDGWNESDDRMLDMLTVWLDNLKGR